MLNFDCSTLKHALQNIQNDCLQWLSYSCRVHQIRFPSLQRSPRPPSWFKGDLLLRGRGREGEEDGREGKGRREEGKGWEGKGREGEGTAPLTQIPGSAPETDRQTDKHNAFYYIDYHKQSH